MTHVTKEQKTTVAAFCKTLYAMRNNAIVTLDEILNEFLIDPENPSRQIFAFCLEVAAANHFIKAVDGKKDTYQRLRRFATADRVYVVWYLKNKIINALERSRAE